MRPFLKKPCGWLCLPTWTQVCLQAHTYAEVAGKCFFLIVSILNFKNKFKNQTKRVNTSYSLFWNLVPTLWFCPSFVMRKRLSHNAFMYVNYIFIDAKMLRKGKHKTKARAGCFSIPITKGDWTWCRLPPVTNTFGKRFCLFFANLHHGPSYATLSLALLQSVLCTWIRVCLCMHTHPVPTDLPFSVSHPIFQITLEW